MNYRPGEALVWKSRDNDGYATTRPVTFRGLRGGGQTAVVTFGDGDHQVAVDELSLPGPRERPYWVAPPIQVPPPPTAPTPPSEGELNECIAERRAALRTAYGKLATAQDLVASARLIADRAQAQVKAARLQLVSANAADRRYSEAMADAIKKGETPPPYTNGIDREALRHSVAAAEVAQTQFDSELASAQAALTEALSNVRTSARATLAALIDREAENLRALEQAASRCRAELIAASTLAEKLSPAAARLLEGQPTSTVQPPVPALIAPWDKVLLALIQGNAEADFALEGDAT